MAPTFPPKLSFLITVHQISRFVRALIKAPPPQPPPPKIPKSQVDRLILVSALNSLSLVSSSLAQPVTLVSLVSPSLSGHRLQIPNPQQVSSLGLLLSTLSLWSLRLLLNQSLWSLWSLRLSPVTAPQIPNPQQVDRLRLLLSILSLWSLCLLLTALRSLSGHRSCDRSVIGHLRSPLSLFHCSLLSGRSVLIAPLTALCSSLRLRLRRGHRICRRRLPEIGAS
ncbi:hypothetical protein Syun_009334 [Stephania yunnanensis]|uniref:Uncharacterized protein n=1 Tax=Stephania yunnanensis TaxID=152371 RepID=A0AAP0KFD2_9MAGN